MSKMVLKGKEELSVPGAQKTGEENEGEKGGRAIRKKKNHDASLVLKMFFQGRE